MVVLFSSFVTSTFNNFSLFVSGVEPVLVGDESALRAAVNAADGPAIIALTADITLTDSALVIPYGKDITLISDKSAGFWKLVGVANQDTIIVDGVLTLDGIIVTHAENVTGHSGVTVEFDGVLTMFGGEISGNIGGYGGGVCNNVNGNFSLFDGKIFENIANYGGGVHNAGDRDFESGFFMFGGEISGNTANEQGGGVHNHGDGIFSLFDGKISNNITVRQ